ncbi:1-acyl-sn-glycerol-3-phosphate acyltransferase alpha-like [Amphiura filiformis]|uniref:1-acyl-sn-glycerol-3-phosphate acyltransferase alpha-like n=1 Tax=Amphiura filiformis TaxID=82378 RepID=UPI003B221807
MDLDFVQILIITVLIVLPLLYELSSTFKYYAKVTFYYIIVMTQAFIVFLLALPRWKDPENAKFLCWFISFNSKLFGIKPEVRGAENLNYNEPCVIVCNHQSALDLIGMYGSGVWPPRCVPLAKKELRLAGPVGWASWITGTVYIDRLNPEKSQGTIDNAVQHMKDKNLKVWIFPEGTRNHECGLLPFKKGAFHLAVNAQVPIIPVVFSSYSEFYSKKEKRFGTGKFVVTVLPPVFTKGYSAEDAGKLAEYVRKQMLGVFNETSMQRLESNGVYN